MESALSLNRLSRIPKRLADDAKLFRLASNWRELLSAKRKAQSFPKIVLRNGVLLETPGEMDLNFLFHEIWLDEIYGGKGYKIGPDDTVIDIGGNIGVFAAYAASRADGVTVYSFEPFPKNAEYFLSNMAKSRLSNVTLQNLAVAGKPGTRTLRVANSWGCHSLGTDGDKTAAGVEVQCTTLDKIISDAGKCDFLKIDCEGGEYEILRNTTEATLRAVKKIVCEYHNTEQGTGPELKELLTGKQFRVDRFDEIDARSGMLYATNLAYRPLV
jgi:FkbM family methyltransferase